MADEALLNLLKNGVDAWNGARVDPDGREAYERMIWGGDLSEAVVDPALKKHEELLTRKARQ
jgi:hypothetical protein